ncbi:hypothetical protein E2562_037440 [Oryza meyeriana var. granulata]|uniref:Importin-7/11-like TPR repeats domain-containing protein n=1 Tax=Oryza meyeriana var. granulata TaxID=110450 RepID=A0A6G1FG90_9ORYZ|nr:hypothetical protein E2562_037440 [Oryza meyeriana var. granulata]
MNDCHDPLAIVHEMSELQIQPRTEESESQILVAEASDLVWAEEPQYGITIAGPNRIEEEETEHYMDPGFDAEGDDPPGADEEWRYFKKKAAGGDAKGAEKAKTEKVKPAKKKGKENEHREDHTCASTSKVKGKEATKGWIANRATDVLRVDTTVGAKKLQQQLEQQFPIKLSYSKFDINPMVDKTQWPVVDLGFVMVPPKLERPAGRPRVRRIKSSGEAGKRGPYQCKRCFQFGHIEKTCREPLAELGDELPPLIPAQSSTSSYKIKEDIKTLFLYSTGQPGANNKKHCSFAIYSNYSNHINQGKQLRAQVLSFILVLLEYVGNDRIIPFVSELSQFFQKTWEESSGECLLQRELLATIRTFITSLGYNSPLCYGMFLPIFQYGINVDSANALNLLEDTVLLLEETLSNAPSIVPQLLDFFPHLVGIMNGSFDHLEIMINIIEYYIVLVGSDLLQSHATSLESILDTIVGNANDKGLRTTLPIIDLVVQMFPQEVPPLISAALQIMY